MADILAELIGLIFGVVADASSPNVEYFKMTNIWSDATAFGGFVRVMYDTTSMIGFCLIIVYFLLELNQKIALEGRDLTMKTFFAPFLKLMVAFAAIEFSGTVVARIIEFGDGLLDKMNGALVSTGFDGDLFDEIDTAEEAITLFGLKDVAFFAALLLIIVGLLALIIGWVLKLVWWYKSLLYRAELLVRVAYLPIAVSDVYQGSHSNCIRYIKGFLAHVIWGASMVGLPKLVTAIAYSAFEVEVTAGDAFGIIGAVLSMLVVPFAAIAITSTVKQVAKEALG